MRSVIPWYYLDEADWALLWKDAIITFDANVLLDLYRLNHVVRTELMKSIGQYTAQIWLTRQTVDEFTRNRRKVISSALGEFGTYKKNIETAVELSVNKLKNMPLLRIIPAEITNCLIDGIRKSFELAENDVDSEKEKYNNSLDMDDTLKEIFSLFDGKVGDMPAADVRSAQIKEAIGRYKKKIPPGYKDYESKSDDDAAGDFIFWMQALEYAKSQDKPLIIVTSEDKEDWFDKYHGQSRPRVELLKEGYEYVGHHVQIIRTKQFFTENSKAKINPPTPESVRDVENVIEHRVEYDDDAAVKNIKAAFSEAVRRVDIADAERNSAEAYFSSIKHSHPGRSPSFGETEAQFQKRVQESYRHIQQQKVIAEEAVNIANANLAAAVSEATDLHKEYSSLIGRFVSWSEVKD